MPPALPDVSLPPEPDKDERNPYPPFPSFPWSQLGIAADEPDGNELNTKKLAELVAVEKSEAVDAVADRNGGWTLSDMASSCCSRMISLNLGVFDAPEPDGWLL